MMFPTETSRYEFHEVINQDIYSTSYRAKCIDNDKIISLKQINLESKDINLPDLQKQIKFWTFTHSDNVLKYHGSFIESNYLYLLSEYNEYGTLDELLKTQYLHGIADEKLAASFIEEIINIFSFLHSSKIVHKNTELSHFQIDQNGSLKLNEFDSCESLINHDILPKSLTPIPPIENHQFIAPEIQKNGYSEKSDIWSIGLIIIELLTGASPKSTYFNISTLETLTSNNSGAARDFIKTCLEIDPESRPSIDQLRRHKFVKMSKGKKYIAQKMKDILPLLKKQKEANFSPYQGKRPKVKIRTKSDDVLEFDFENSPILVPDKKIRRVSGSEIQIGRFTICKASRDNSDDQKSEKNSSSSNNTRNLDSMKIQIDDLNKRSSELESSNNEMMLKINNLLETIKKMKK